jgi:hypothetical protein
MARKRNTKAVKVGHKLHEDGKAIADTEKAVHNLKATVHSKPSGKLQSTANLFPTLLGSVEEQEAAWLLAVTDPERFAARVPISQVTGIIPVDLFRKQTVYECVANANNQAYAMFQPDAWHQRSSGISYYSHLLHADGANATYGTCTSETYALQYFPVPGLLPTGSLACLVGNVSSEITSDANDGTEYIMVACKHALRAKQVASAAADAQFSGRVTAFYSADTERYPISATAGNVLQAQAREEDSMVFMRQYLITQSGLFVPLENPEMEPMSEISTVSLPLTTDSYEWQRVGASNLADSTYVAANSDVGFFIEAPQNTRFEVESTYLWQVERYGDNRVASRGPEDAEDVIAQSGNFTVQTQDTHVHYGDDPAHAPGGTYNLGGYTPPGGHRREVLAATPVAVTETPKKSNKSKIRRRNASHRGTVPPVIGTLAHAVSGSPGHPIHPAVPLLAVTSQAASNPGVHQLMARDPNGLRNITPAKVAQFAVKHGPMAAAKMAEATRKPGWTWKDLLKGVWDVAKTVGPAVAGLLL